ncbi:MAG TPA: hypothetical protein VEI74_03015 [Candidatus Methylomirabilis sp.]|nr:hypothetical protein [Candidatus Methylomirabilis sp.]
MPQDLTHAQFAGCLNELFRIYADAGSFDVELIQAEVLGSRHDGPGRRVPFSLVFRGPLEPVLPQRIYRLEHGGLGTLEIFLVPLGPDKDGMRYEAVFN